LRETALSGIGAKRLFVRTITPTVRPGRGGTEPAEISTASTIVDCSLGIYDDIVKYIDDSRGLVLSW
jgi:hypothetical protein